MSPVVAIARTPTGHGYWVANQAGTVTAFGDARDFGDPGALATTGAVAGIAATPSGAGYWLVTRDGAVLPFGDARYHGDRQGYGAHDVAGIVASPAGAGYWLFTDAGVVSAFGDAHVDGSRAGNWNAAASWTQSKVRSEHVARTSTGLPRSVPVTWNA